MPRLSFTSETWERVEQAGEGYGVTEVNSLLNSLVTELVTLRKLLKSGFSTTQSQDAAVPAVSSPSHPEIQTTASTDTALLEDLSGLLNN